MSSTYWKSRAELADRPGGLAAASSAIAGLGANILDVDVQLLEPGRWPTMSSSSSPTGPNR